MNHEFDVQQFLHLDDALCFNQMLLASASQQHDPVDRAGLGIHQN